MALNAFMRLKGQKQGVIKGSVAQKGREESIMVIAVSHEIVSPRDPASQSRKQSAWPNRSSPCCRARSGGGSR